MEAQIKKLANGLLAVYQDIEQHFNQLASEPDNVSRAETMMSVRESLVQAKQIESELFPLRDQMVNAGQAMQPETQLIFEQATRAISQLLPQVNLMEKAAIEERDKLSPIIRDSVRGLQMQSAYSQNQ